MSGISDCTDDWDLDLRPPGAIMICGRQSIMESITTKHSQLYYNNILQCCPDVGTSCIGSLEHSTTSPTRAYIMLKPPEP